MYIKRIKKKGERDICDEKKETYTLIIKKNGTANKKKDAPLLKLKVLLLLIRVHPKTK